MPAEALESSLPFSRSVRTPVTVVVPMSMARAHRGFLSSGGRRSRTRTLPSGRRSATARTEKLFSRSVFASFSMTKKGTSTFFVPAASSMAQVRRSTSGMVSSSVGSAMVRTVEK